MPVWRPSQPYFERLSRRHDPMGLGFVGIQEFLGHGLGGRAVKTE